MNEWLILLNHFVVLLFRLMPEKDAIRIGIKNTVDVVFWVCEYN